MDNVREEIREKYARKQESYRNKRTNVANDVENVVVNKLCAERGPDGLYTVRFTNGGSIPVILQGKYTSIERIKQLVCVKYGSTEILQT